MHGPEGVACSQNDKYTYYHGPGIRFEEHHRSTGRDVVGSKRTEQWAPRCDFQVFLPCALTQDSDGDSSWEGWVQAESITKHIKLKPHMGKSQLTPILYIVANVTDFVSSITVAYNYTVEYWLAIGSCEKWMSMQQHFLNQNHESLMKSDNSVYGFCVPHSGSSCRWGLSSIDLLWSWSVPVIMTMAVCEYE